MFYSHSKHSATRGWDLRQHGHCANSLWAQRRDEKRALSRETWETRQGMKRELTCGAIVCPRFPGRSQIPHADSATRLQLLWLTLEEALEPVTICFFLILRMVTCE